jgi:predicted small secreted protein
MRATTIFFALFTVMMLVLAGCNTQSNDGDDMTLDDITGKVVGAKDTPSYDDDPGKVSAGDTV